MTTGQNGLSHDRCGARTRTGGRCGLPAGWGTSHVGSGACRKHGGNMPNHLVRARRVLAERAVQTFGLPTSISPERALLDELARANGAVLWLARRVAELEPAALTWGVRKRVTREAADGESEITTEHAAAINLWVVLFQNERDRLREVARAALVTSAEVALADGVTQLARKMADLLDTATAGLGWAERDQVMARFAEQLAVLETAPDPRPDTGGDTDGRA
jgi:hypothetical protein